MKDPYNKLARLMRTRPEELLELERKMDTISGQEGVFEDILRQNEITVDRTLAGLGLSRADDVVTVRAGLNERLSSLDARLWELVGKPDLSKPDEACQKLCAVVSKVFSPPRGLFLKRELGIKMLEQYPPQNLLEHFGYTSVQELIEKEGFSSVMAALRFTQTEQWMHQFFDVAYENLGPDDFEEREVEHIILQTKWLAVAEKYMKKKYHNVSHLKEFGIIFVIPLKSNMHGETLRLVTLMLHYLHEVPFYAALFRRHLHDVKFPQVFKSLLRGDVSVEHAPNGGRVTWRVVQRYLAKDNAMDFRLQEPHVNPEADHWWRAEEDLGRLSRIIGNDGHGDLALGWWTGLDFVGEEFMNRKTGVKELISFDLIDQLMSLVRKSENSYLYHQQEALWNKIFVEYMGRERMQQLIEENLLSGFIFLE